jgi:hypothetical protein
MPLLRQGAAPHLCGPARLLTVALQLRVGDVVMQGLSRQMAEAQALLGRHMADTQAMMAQFINGPVSCLHSTLR